MYDVYREQLTEAGVVWLENQDVHVTAGGIPFRICGLDLKGKYYGRLRVPHLPAGEIRDHFGEPDPSECTILLAHTPRMMKTYQDWGADITFCGHYHGGVMRIGKNRGLISPDLRVFPGNAYGIFPNQGKYVIVSSGCGEHTIPLRIRNPREIVCCTVRGC